MRRPSTLAVLLLSSLAVAARVSSPRALGTRGDSDRIPVLASRGPLNAGDLSGFPAVAKLLPRHEDHEEPSATADAPAAAADRGDLHSHSEPSAQPPLPPEHEHEHEHVHSHAAPLLVINETQILLTHSPDPPAYFEFDMGPNGQRGLLLAHIFFMSSAFFVLLPLAIFLKSGGSHLSLVPQAAFVLSAVLGTVLGAWYNSLTPPLYEGSSHSRLGWVTMALVMALNAVDVFQFAIRVKAWLAGRAAPKVIIDTDDEERQSLVEKDAELPERLVVSPVEETTEVNWNEVHGQTSRIGQGRVGSTLSDDTLLESAPAASEQPMGLRARLVASASLARTLLQGSLVLLAYVQLINGIAVYSGSCRERYGNGCLAHLIKGSIFLWYGMLTFARFLGCFSEIGWAWNRRPVASSSSPSAEFVESAVIFAYGITNTWLERLGKTGAYSVKDIQHISIAVMFWFAGGLGMLMESRRVRSWLSFSAILASRRPASEVAEPASFAFSFNPFPALVIGVTGVAMAAHHQTYQFQVDIHALWGLLLGGFATFRFLTYAFLYLRPPASILPSRPPTEALAAFSLTCGGVVFMLSTEQVTFAAMRHNFDDVMAFLNFTVALVCVWFTWLLCLMATRGWALVRTRQPVEVKHEHHRSASMHSPRHSMAKSRRLAHFA